MSKPQMWNAPVPEVERLLRRCSFLDAEIRRLERSLESAIDRKLELIKQLTDLGVANTTDLRNYAHLTGSRPGR